MTELEISKKMPVGLIIIDGSVNLLLGTERQKGGLLDRLMDLL